jgi:Ca2+/Na+ antiporter
MAGISDLFIPPDDIRDDGFGWVQLLFLTGAYGYILYRASKLIADGSELLSIVLDPGLVGGLVLPVMGAVPDGAIVLFSGLGDDAQEQLKVGVGTLAGSTIMLVTIPWAACALLGRVDINDDGNCNYNAKGGEKLTQGMNIFTTGVQPPATIRSAAKICLLTCITYFVIQGPAFGYSGDSTSTQAHKEKGFALAGFLLAVAAFAGYSAYCVFSATAIEKQKARLTQARKHAVTEKLVSMMTLLHIESELADGSSSSSSSSEQGKEGALLEGSSSSTVKPASTAILRSLFDRFDTDGSGELDKGEVKAMLLSMGMRVSADTLNTLVRDIGGADMKVQFHEFEALIRRFQKDPTLGGTLHVAGDKKGAGAMDLSLQASGRTGAGEDAPHAGGEEEEEDDDEEEEEEDEEAAGLTPAQIKMRAFITLAFGVGLVTLFSDPMVDVLTVIGNRLDVSPFYISFIVTPIVSNASELISSIQSSAKKTRKSIDMTYSQLLGAATMNNTFCLAIFLILVYLKDLAWQFSAEVLAILLVEAAIVIITLTSKKDVLPLWKAGAVLCLYPASLLFVYLLENVAGLD